jgi:hypothetical protein
MGACHVHRVADMLELSPRRMNIDAPIPMPSSSHKKKKKESHAISLADTLGCGVQRARDEDAAVVGSIRELRCPGTK